MRVPKVWRSDVVDVGSHDGLLEATNELRAVERVARVWVTEHEVAVARVQGPLTEFAQRDGGALGERDGASGTRGLRVAELPADERGDDTNEARLQVDVAPPHSEKLAVV
jgi:hypothetical protein